MARRARARDRAIVSPLVLLVLIVLVGCSLAGPAAADAQRLPGAAVQDEVVEAIRQRVERVRETGVLSLGPDSVPSAEGLAELYERRSFRPLWSSARLRTQLVAAIAAAEADGLTPAHYHLAALRALALRGDGGSLLGNSAADPDGWAAADLLCTQALLSLGYDLARGRVDPRVLDASWHVVRPGIADLADSLAASADRGDVAGALARLRPQHVIYRSMMQALARYRALADDGGWPTLPPGTVLARDSVGPAVPLLRRRLALEGDLAQREDTASATFDAALDSALRAFQHRHGLNTDGVVGPATLAELNTAADDRVRQLRTNMERARWVLRELADTFLTVNVAGQRVYVVHGDSVVHEARAVVGRAYTRTPVFAAPMRYVVVNPTWTVPRSINGEILARIRSDPDYLVRQRFQVLDAEGRAVDPATVDFERYTGGSFPYVFRQGPGPTNALGRIKFMFPNQFNVYLHDTPERGLFALEQRLFSHGCIRVQDPLALGALLLDGWDPARLEAAVAAGETRTIDLARPLPVLVLYWTAATDLHGEVHFYRDIYGRDAALLDALDRD